MMITHLVSRDIESGVPSREEDGLGLTNTQTTGDFPEGEDNKQNEKKKKKKKKMNASMKPPRPSKGPFLDAADLKFVQEITELAIRRRARIERIKPLKKMKATKSSSWSTTLSAFLITIMFCLMLFQGIGTRSHGRLSSQGSLAPSVAATGDFISVQLSNNFRPVFEDRGAGSGYPSSASVSRLQKR